MIKQSHTWTYNPTKTMAVKDTPLQYSLKHYLQQPGYGSYINVLSPEEWIKKPCFTHTMEFYSVMKRKEIVPFAETWMDPETVIQNSVFQRQKSKSCIVTHICGLQKRGIDELICKTDLETTENKPMYIKVKSCGAKNWEMFIDIYTLLILCLRYITNENLLYSSGNSTECSRIT